MAIIAMTGLPGGGKSYGAVAHQVIPALRRGRRVVTNLPLVRDELRKLTPKGEIVEFPTEDILEEPERVFEYVTAGSVLILDEVWKIWPAGQKVNQVPQPFKHLIAEHRHMLDSKGQSVSIVLVTQDLGDIGTFARNKVATTLHHVKLDHVGAAKRFRVDVYRGSVSGPEPPEGRKLRTIYGTYRPEIYRCYRSHTMAEGDVTKVDEASVDGRANIWRRPSIWLGLAFVIAAPVYGVTQLARIVSPSAETSVASSAPATESATAGSAEVDRDRVEEPRPESVSAAVPAVIERRVAPDYRIAGVVRSTESRQGFVAIASGDRVINVPWSSCHEPGDGLTRCAFNGWTVTELGAE